jgi:hypothetical protein
LHFSSTLVEAVVGFAIDGPTLLDDSWGGCFLSMSSSRAVSIVLPYAVVELVQTWRKRVVGTRYARTNCGRGRGGEGWLGSDERRKLRAACNVDLQVVVSHIQLDGGVHTFRVRNF